MVFTPTQGTKHQHVRILTKEVKIPGSRVEMKKGLCDTWVAINGWEFSLAGKSQRRSQTKDMRGFIREQGIHIKKYSNETFRISKL